MTATQIAQRQRAVASAVGSVRAEGLSPSAKAKKRLKDYADGKITASQLHAGALSEIKAKVRK